MPHRTRFLPLLLALAILAAAAPPAARAQSGERCFPETGQCISGPIRTFWEQNGGLAVFGLPLGPLQEYAAEGGRTVQAQWFERHRLELHPENPAPYNVLLGRLGVDRLEQQGRDWRSFPPLDPNDADAERCRFFSETNHQVCDEFLQAFRSSGLSFAGRPGITFEESLALFGLPISEPMTETIEGREYTVQWFERARFELHPENQPPYNVLFGRLGAELGGGQGAVPAPALEGREWRLVSFGPAAAPTPAAATPASTLSFDGERVSGNTGCNGFGGSYQASGGTLTFGPVISTLIACADETINAQEQAIFAALQGSVPYTIAGETLRISYGDGQALTYSSAPAPAGAALIGREWRLVSFGAAGAPTPAAGGRAATISFDGERVGGSTGCNSFSGPYQAAGGALTFGPLASTAALCTDEALAAQEQAILGALQGAAPYSVEGETLRISYGDGQALTYSSAAVGGAADLAGRVWELASFGDPDAANLPAAGGVATLVFAGGRVSGSTGCNNLTGPYEATDQRITFGPLAVTRALCTSDELARQEAAILGALAGEAPFTVVGDTLTIGYGDGQALTYRATGAEPPPSR